MRKKKERIRVLRSIAVCSLAAVMTVPAGPVTAYGAQVSGINEIYTAAHHHVWKYKQQGAGLVTAVCQETQGLCDAGQINLTLTVEKDSRNQNKAVLLADGIELSGSDDRDISYQIRYYDQNGSSIGTQPPQKNGKYKVRAIFGASQTSTKAPYLEADYTIQHTHSWKYDKSWEGASVVTAVCQETQGFCDAGRTALTLRVEKDSQNKKRAVVLADGTELSESNDWGISYRLRYYNQNGGSIGTQPPQKNGKYKVRAVFGTSQTSAKAPYLEADYTIQHTHNWKYEKSWEGSSVVTAVCEGNEGFCDAGRIALTLRVEKDSENKKRAVVLADGAELSGSNDWDISYRLRYYDQNGSSIGTQPPQKNGKYKVRAVFGSSQTSAMAPYLEADYTIQHIHSWKYEKSWEGSSVVTAVCQETEGFCDAGRMELTLKVEKESDYTEEPRDSRVTVSADGMPLAQDNEFGITYKIEYFQDTEAQPDYGWSGEPREPGTYGVKVTFGGKDSAFIKDTFTIHPIEKESRSGITVKMKSHYDQKGKMPAPQLNRELEDGAEITYYYSMENQNTGGGEWSVSEGKKLKAGIYYMYAVIGETDDYKSYATPVCKFTVHADHKWNMPGHLSKKKATKKTVSCSYCGKREKIKLPAKTVSVVMGKSVVIKSKGCTFGKVSKKYFSLSSSGKITTKADPQYYHSMKTSVPVSVKACGKTYNMKVKLAIPAPKVNLIYRKSVVRNEPGLRFEFQYYVPKADKVQVWMDEVNRFEKSGEIKQYFEKHFSNPRPGKTPYIHLANRGLKKAQTVTFHIRACYGPNKSRAVQKSYRYIETGGTASRF